MNDYQNLLRRDRQSRQRSQTPQTYLPLGDCLTQPMMRNDTYGYRSFMRGLR